MKRYKVELEGTSAELLNESLSRIGLRLNIFDTDQGYLPTLEIVNVEPYCILMVFRKTDHSGLTLQTDEAECLKLKSLIIRRPKDGLFVLAEGKTFKRISQIGSQAVRDSLSAQ